MNNENNGAILNIILHLEEPNKENLEKLENYTRDFLIRQNASETDIVDHIINEAKKMYNAGKKTPGVMAVVNIIRENDEKIYDLNSSNDAISRTRVDESVITSKHGVGINIIVIGLAIILGLLLGYILILIAK